MTAEVAILNKIAVALAADSAASIGDDAEKIYYTNKLFSLSDFCPVGVMIYDSVDYLMTPLETIIKLFREDRKDSTEQTIRDYVDKFISFLGRSQFLNEITERNHIKHVVRGFLSDVKNDVDNIAIEIIGKTGKYPRKSPERILSEVVRSALSELQRADPIKSLSDISQNHVIDTYRTEIENAIKDILMDFKIDVRLRTKIYKLVSSALLKGKSDISSGIVMAGFGEQEIFPRLVHVIVDGALCGKLKYWEVKDSIIDPVKQTAAIYPFAQREMVARFVGGVDQDYLNWIDITARKVLTGFAEELIKTLVLGKSITDKFLKHLPEIVNMTITEFSKSSEKFRKKKYINPVLGAVEFLPKEELANMAEALVSLTSTKRRVSREKETVGGPVDVAVISKGDGFVWVKRKQYFRADLNPQFDAPYWARKGQT